MIYLLDGNDQVVGAADYEIDTELLHEAGLRAVRSPLAHPVDRVTTIGAGEQLRVIERAVRPEPPAIFLSAVGHGEGGDLELDADGRSSVQLQAELSGVTEAADQPGTGPEVRFRTTAGRLSARRVTAINGTARVWLTASLDTVQGLVLADAPGHSTGRLRFELVPPSEAERPCEADTVTLKIPTGSTVPGKSDG